MLRFGVFSFWVDDAFFSPASCPNSFLNYPEPSFLSFPLEIQMTLLPNIETPVCAVSHDDLIGSVFLFADSFFEHF